MIRWFLGNQERNEERNIITMYKIDFNHPIEIHFIGIGGISMSGLAEVLLKAGFTITGSDWHESDLTKHLEKLGALVHYGQKAENITDTTQVMVFTAAVKPDNPEYQEAVRRGIPILSRAELLGQIMENYSTSIGVSGTHGKTTTTSMLSEIMLEAELSPTISVGGILDCIHGNIRVGNSQYFITEACEYMNSFFSFYPTIGIILNVCADHLDFFKDLDDIRKSFRRYTKNISDNGTLIINGDIENLPYFIEDLSCKVVTFGLTSSCQFSAVNIRYDAFACASYDLMINHTVVMHITLSVPGEHNILNSLAAIAAAYEMQIPPEKIQKGLSGFCNAERRFEKKGQTHGFTIIDDYAHHPDEIRATLTAAENYPHHELWCVFQPHTYSRTKALLKEFAKALSLADHVVLADIYSARETDTLGISSETLLEELKKLGSSCYYFDSFEKIEEFLFAHCINGDLLITMGAGDVVNIGEDMLKR